MNLTDQVISLDLAKRLKALGVPQDSMFWWVCVVSSSTEPGDELATRREGRRLSQVPWEGNKNSYAAFTVSELVEMLPKGYRIVSEKTITGKWRIPYRYNRFFEADTEAEVRGLMCEYLITNKLITV